MTLNPSEIALDFSVASPPVLEKRSHTVRVGRVEGENRGPNPMDPPVEFDDPYFWIRDDSRKDPKMLVHLKAEDDYCKKVATPLKLLVDAIYKEHLDRLKETDCSAPTPNGPFDYFTRTIKGKAYELYCQRPLSSDPIPTSIEDPTVLPEREICILDVNQLAEGRTQCDVHSVIPSPSHELFSYTIDYFGHEDYTHVIARTPQNSTHMLPEIVESITDVADDFCWGATDKTFYYVTCDEAHRAHKVWRHTIGTPQSDDLLVLHEPDVLFGVGVDKTLCGKYLIVGRESYESTEEWLLDLEAAETTETELRDLLQLVAAHIENIRYNVIGVSHGNAFILTNKDGSLNNKLAKAPLTTLSEWTDVISHSQERFISEGLVFKDFAVLKGRVDGCSSCWCLCFDNSGELDVSTLHKVSVPEPIGDLSLGLNHNFDSSSVRLVYISPVTPQTWWDYFPKVQSYHVVKQKELPGYDPSEYQCERIWATAPDSVRIPMSVVYKKTLDRSKPQPTMLYGYGSYGLCMNANVSARTLGYTSHDMIYVVAHIRGGSELGREWYETHGKYRTKRNTFSDFIACAEHLIATGVTTSNQLACEGRSAGGLLMGAVANMRPDLFKMMIAFVPFVDVVTTMCDPSIPLTTGEWYEWGNPNEYKYFDYMRSYCPITNVRAQHYPTILVHCGLYDPRVAYWEPVKWVAKLREFNRALQNNILLEVELDKGHFAATDRYAALKEAAFQQALVLTQTF